MRICILTHGATLFGRHYAQALADRGQDVHMFLLSHAEHSLPDTRVHVFAPPRLDLANGSRIWYLRTILPIRRAVRALRPDILFALYVSSAGLVGALSGHRRLVLSARGSDVVQHVGSRAWRSVLRWAGRRSRLFHAVSDELSAMLRDRVGVPAEKLFVCPIGVDIDALRFVDPAERPGDGHILCTRSHVPVYDQPTFVRALKLLRDRGASFRVTFASANGAGLTEALVQQAGLGDRVRFLGGYSLSGLPDLLAGADVYVSCSLSDGTSSSLLEAMSTGLFPVVSDIPANRPWVADQHNGLLFPVRDAEALANQLARALAEPGLRAAAARRNREIIVERGDKQVLMDRLLAVLKKCVSQS